MRVRVEGHVGKRPPVVFIHGAGGSATVWLDLFRHFERSHKVVAPDLPAHGQSEPWHEVSDGERLIHYRDAVSSACAELGIERPLLVGHSMGGLVALALAAAHPERVAGLVLVNAAVGMKPSEPLLAALAARPADQALLLAELGWSPSTPRDTVMRWARSVTSAEPEVTLADLRAVDAFTMTDAALASLETRVLLLGGEDDLLCPPALVRATLARLRDAQCILVPAAGHHVHLELPDIAIRAIEDFATFV